MEGVYAERAEPGFLHRFVEKAALGVVPLLGRLRPSVRACLGASEVGTVRLVPTLPSEALHVLRVRQLPPLLLLPVHGVWAVKAVISPGLNTEASGVLTSPTLHLWQRIQCCSGKCLTEWTYRRYPMRSNFFVRVESVQRVAAVAAPVRFGLWKTELATGVRHCAREAVVRM